MTRRTRAALASMMAVSGLLAGCSSDDLTGPEGDQTALSLSVALGPDGIVGAVRSVFDVEQSDGTNVLVMSRVAIVLRDIELERQFDDCPEPGEEFDEDECEKFETGPILLELPLDGQAPTRSSLTLRSSSSTPRRTKKVRYRSSSRHSTSCGRTTRTSRRA